MDADVIVIGAGTSGMMAAISAAKHGAKTILIEKNKKVGKKLLLTGGGRCNVTNNREPEDIIKHIPGNGKFLYSAFSQFNNYDIMTFFEEQGVHLKEEDHGRMFPVTDRSKTIVNALWETIQQLPIQVFTGTTVKKILAEEKNIQGVILDTNERLLAPCVIISTGGKTYPQTGSTGDGYRFAKKLGHTVTPLFATESPLLSSEDFIQEKRLQGLALQDVALSVLQPATGKKAVTHNMDLLFTHFGLSGPAALRCSAHVQHLLDSHPQVTMELDALPKQTVSQTNQQLLQLQQEQGKKSVKNGWRHVLPERYLLFLLEQADIKEDMPLQTLSHQMIEQFSRLVHQFQFTVYKTWPIERSFVTGGGISLKEITPQSMESKLVQGLFFTGEVLDINGYTGGFNITAAFVTGYVAGKHASDIASYYHF
ncbi:NAD(P)/FAD-dependent oxidoreductase [Vagococcus humatus]|uniref:Aminoacetone oxidase family FAD-binding enzyme n=1 Tax=Vagococcus humatus TaxID=1889241 RepID=A0A429Z785_9ENTE|nr:NAD(P)/FAD-dependent oxidoreductase [Vagococcus humatus]RST89599.1 aminoacetone oxidase family FAD-binding enzyme [Vagococcus humatus]